MKIVEIEITTRIGVEVPDDWTDADVEFRYNEGTWCADNLPEEIGEHIDRALRKAMPGYDRATADEQGIGFCSGLCDVTTVKAVRPDVIVVDPPSQAPPIDR